MLECRHEKEINSNHRSFDKEDKIMEYRYPHLCSPITLGNTTFKSRIFSAPMGGTDITADCCIGPKSTKFYELRQKAAQPLSPSRNAWFIRKRTEVTHIIWISPFREAFRVSLTLQMRSAATAVSLP